MVKDQDPGDRYEILEQRAGLGPGYFAGTHQAIHWTHNGGAVVSFTVLFDDD
jgi:hypothetical protein